MNTKTKIAGIEFNSYVLNAAGPNDSTLEELEILGNSSSSAIMMKSSTIEPRQGNEKPRYVKIPFGSVQSMGLPNLGYKEYIKFAALLKKYNKPIIGSIAGLCIKDYITMVQEFQNSEVDLIEINFSCPNIEGKPQVAYDIEQSEEILKAISNLGDKPIGLKLPPYYDFVHHKQMAELIKKYNVAFITCINSVGNVLVIDPETEKPRIKPKKGFGGLGGSCIKPIALANVRKFYELLEGKVQIFGVGGIQTGIDVFEFLLAGADAVQVATTFKEEGASCFERINKEFEAIMQRKNYNSIEEVKGNLKFL